MSRNEVISWLGEDWTRTVALIRSSLGTDVQLLQDTNDNILSHTGKMLRPMLSLLIARACGTVTEDSIHYAACAELLHNATLMHDDIVDGSPERRGAPTVAAMLGPSSAVLVGDYWLAKAVGLVYRSGTHARVVNHFVKTLSDLAEGEMLQLEKASSADTDEDAYFRIIYCKTGSLFVASATSAADSVDASPEVFNAVKEYATDLGIAFQIKDDILDYIGDERLGKPVGADLKERKITLPLLGALKGSPREMEIRNMVRDIQTDPDNLDKVRSFVEERNGVAYASARLDEYIAAAEKALEIIPDSKAKEYLCDLARYNAFRKV